MQVGTPQFDSQTLQNIKVYKTPIVKHNCEKLPPSFSDFTQQPYAPQQNHNNW